MNTEANVCRYLYGGGSQDVRDADARYASFDFCFNYFQSFSERGAVSELADDVNIQRSCLELGFYLASWGMLRGRADLLQRSVRGLAPLVREIAVTPPDVWSIDADEYSVENINTLLGTATALRHANGGMSDVLVTKVMLGVFGNVPAFDRYFRAGAAVSSFGAKALTKIAAYYADHADIIDAHRVYTLDFVTGQPTHRRYTRAKVIDMAFFIEGMQ